MRLESFRCHAMGPFRDFEVDLTRLAGPLVAVTGENGAGKTTFLELAVPGALYRETPTRGSLVELATARDAFFESTQVHGAHRWTFRHTADVVSKKSEAVVLDDGGRPVLPDSKVKSFDAWAAKNLPLPEVLYASVFASQGATGFLGAKPSERKAVLLRVLGIERIERQAEQARQHREEAARSVEAQRIRLEDERNRGGDLGAIEREIACLGEAVQGADAALADARGALELGRSGAPAIEMARREAAAARAKRAELQSRIGAKRTELGQLETKIANNRAVLADAERIREAKARTDELAAEMARLGEQLKGAEDRRVAAARERDQHGAASTAAKRRASAAHETARAARVRIETLAPRINIATAQLPELEAAARNAEAALEEAERDAEQVRNARVAGAEDRIVWLRDGFSKIVRLTGGSPIEIAEEALSKDDEAVRLAAQLPAEIEAALAALALSKDRAAVAARSLSDARQLIARRAEVEAANGEIKRAMADVDAADCERAAADEAGNRAEKDAVAAERDRAAAQEARRSAQDETIELAPLAGKAGPLANAEGRLAELEPQRETTAAEQRALEGELAATPEPPAVPTPPDVAGLEQRVAAAEQAAKGAASALTLAQSRRAAALESAERAAAIAAAIGTLSEELADWTKLAEELGPKGLQNLLIDAAGPEITTLANDLLHAAFGSRFTIRLDTQRLGSDGRLLEAFDVMILDTEGGREAKAETFSGGEKVILSEALSLALTVVACRRAGVERPTLVRDEAGAALSEERAAQWIAMLRRCAEIIGVDRILIVSHSKEVIDLCDDQIDVSARNAASAEAAE